VAATPRLPVPTHPLYIRHIMKLTPEWDRNIFTPKS